MNILTLLITSIVYTQAQLQGNLAIGVSSMVKIKQQGAKSLIIRFTLDSIDNQRVACAVSKSDMTVAQLDTMQLSNDPQNGMLYDYQGVLIKNSQQLVQIEFNEVVYLRCFCNIKITGASIRYEIFQNSDYPVQTCTNDCNGYNYPNQSTSICIDNACNCLNGYFGYFCQFKSTYLMDNLAVKLEQVPGQWTYFTYKIPNGFQIKLTITGVPSIKYSLMLKQIPQMMVPYDSMLMELINTIDITSQVSTLLEGNQADYMLIGLYNHRFTTIQFDFMVTTELYESQDLERNKIIIIVTGSIVGFLLLLSFVLSYRKTRNEQLQQQAAQAQQDARVQEAGIVVIRQQEIRITGFPCLFIQKYFKGHSYKRIIRFYPGLQQFEECTVCLESMKVAGNSKCSVTPCYHLFHNKCLEEWLMRQRTCPFCRFKLTRGKIVKEQWLVLSDQQQSEQEESKYVQRLKHNDVVLNEMTQPQIYLNESQEDLVKKSDNSMLGNAIP